MTTTINASTTLGLQQTADTSGVLALQTANTTAVTIDASQNVGVGVVPSAWVSTAKAIQLGATSAIFYNGSSTSIGDNGYYNGTNNIYLTTNYASRYVQTNGAHYWYQAASGTAGNTISFTQAMTLDASGNLLVGTTSANVGFTTGSKSIVFDNSYGSNYAIVVNQSSASNGYFMGFGRGGSQCGYIWTSASNTTAYVTSSDYRLKENVQPMTGALEKVTALKPCTYTWKEDGTASQGFIAHELAQVVPECVAGEKDAVNEDGSIKAQGIDTSFLVATLTAAIQEQQALITTLTERITALEAK